MSNAIETATGNSTSDIGPVIETQLSPAAVWGVAYRALERYKFCLPCHCPDTTPSAIERAAALACHNLRATMPVTSTMQTEAVDRLVDFYAPNFALWRQRRPEHPQTWGLGQALAAGDEAIHMPSGPDPQPVDPFSARIIDAALRLEAAYDPDDTSRREASDVRLHGGTILHGAVALAA